MARILSGLILALALVASPCEAAAATHQPTEVWRRLGVCESGMNPSMRKVLRNGTVYEGFASFDSRTWDAYAPDEFADDAWRAHIFQQVFVAELVLAEEGWRAWPSCSRRLGYR